MAGADDWRAAAVEKAAARLLHANVAFGHGTDNARDEAFRLVAHAGDAAELEALLCRRIEQRVPLPYLTGAARFAGMRLAAGPGVVIPRSPIAEVLATGVRPWLAQTPRRVLDLCCGGGALGLAAARTFPQAMIDLAEVDAAALGLARANTARLGEAVARRVRVMRSDLFAALAGTRYDLILCNPPYVPTAELDAAPAEFHHEPRFGLDGGADGLAVWRRIVPQLDAHLTAAGVLVGEAGNIGQAFDRAFPELRAIWLDLADAEPQADGGYGVFVTTNALRRRMPKAESCGVAR